MAHVTATGIVSVLAVLGYAWAVRRSLALGCAALLVAGCCLGTHFLTFKVLSWRLTLDRLAFFALVGAYVMQRALGRTKRQPSSGPDWALAALLAVLALSMFTADWRTPGPGDAKPWWHLYAGYVVPAAVYWIARQSALDEGIVKAVLGTLLVFGTYLAITGVLEGTGQSWLVVPRYAADPKQGLAFGCARGPMLHPVSFGLYAGVAMLTAWLCASRLHSSARWLAYAAVPLFLPSLFFTYTRAVWLGAWLGVFVVLALTLPRRWRGVVLASMVVGTVCVLTTQWDHLLSFQRGRESAEGTRHSAYTRLSFTYVSWRMFLDRPWFGLHFGYFSAGKLPYLADRSTSLDLEAIRDLCSHNIFLSLLTETGIVGLVLFLTLLLCWARNAWQLWRNPRAPDWARMPGALLLGALGVYAGCWLFHDLTFAPIDHGLLFLLAGIAVGLRRRSDPRADA